MVLDHSETAPVGAYWTPVSVRHLCNGRRGTRRTRDLDLFLLRREVALEAVVSGDLNILREEREGGVWREHRSPIAERGDPPAARAADGQVRSGQVFRMGGPRPETKVHTKS